MLRNTLARRRFAGASVVEFLTVVSITAILVGLVWSGVQKGRERAREENRPAQEAKDREERRQQAAEALAAAKRREVEDAVAAQQRQVADDAAFQTGLVAFAKAHVPELQAAIDQIEVETVTRLSRCEQLAAELKRLRKDVEADPDLTRWKRAIIEMKEKVVELRKEREEAYLAFKKFELAPSGKADYEAKLRKAKVAAVDSQEYYRKMQQRLETK